MERLFVLSGKERGFTLAEVIVAMAIISFVVLATWRVITSSLHSITRQDQKVKALHISQAHLARLETETFSRVVPENWIIGAGEEYYYQLSIYNQNISSDKIFITPDSDYWYDDGNPDTEDLEFDDTGQDKSDGILVADNKGMPYAVTYTSLPPPKHYNWDSTKLTLTFSSEDVEGEIQIYYRYYHLIDEGATIPSSDGEALKIYTIKLITQAGELSDIFGYDLTEGVPLSSSDYESFDPQSRELTFKDEKRNHSVWVYYLPASDTDSSGPDGAPDGYLDPTENSIVGVAAGNFCNPDGSATNQITKTKEITLTEYWRQGGQIQQAEQKAYILDR